ncbi:MAG: AAA family ATPase [Bacteroidia bacterium]|nr:AAA family ATPase [Bacteroidia bacterium]
MFYREIIKNLKEWAVRDNRKPLVLRGARQVGKTTAVEMFAKEFDQYIALNLEKEEERMIFETSYPFQDLLMALFFYAKKDRYSGRTLIFIDEIQNCPKAVALLRYFKEEAGDLLVIAAGSLLETIMDRKISYPVGRVEFMMLHPVSFREFLAATGENQSLDLLNRDEVPAFAHIQLMRLFKKYLTIGGMPQVVEQYARNKDLTALQPIYESLLKSYIEDVEKYAPSLSQVQYIRHILTTAFEIAGNRITIENFGGSTYKFREMKEAFTTLEKTLLFQLVYPTTELSVSALPKLKLKPRLHTLDTGLINYSTNMVKDILSTEDIADVYRGRIAEHITGQELLAMSNSIMNKLQFWVREKKQSSAEIDYLFQYNGKLIPIEVKSGSIGKLRSLHQFMDHAPHHLAVRVWQGAYSVEKTKTISGTEFTLLNLPFYLVHRLERELDKLIEN